MRKANLKVIVMGNSKVGKTSLIRQYVDNKFAPEYIPTIAEKVFSKRVIIGDCMLNIHDIPVNSDVSIEGINGCILVFDLTNADSFQCLKGWKNLISNKECPSYVVGNKLDMKDKREVSRDRALQWCKDNFISKYFEVSAKSSVDGIFEEIVKDTCEWQNDRMPQCNKHRGNISSQYCETCDVLMCLTCQISHSEKEGHNVLGISDVAFKALKKLQENNAEIIAEDLIAENGQDIEIALASYTTTLIEVKQEMKNEVCELIDEVFGKRIESKLKELADQYKRVASQFGFIKLDYTNIETQPEEINRLLYKNYDYKKIIEIYKDLPNKQGLALRKLKSLKLIKEEVARYIRIADTMKDRFKNAIHSALDPDIWEAQFLKQLNLNDNDYLYTQLAKEFTGTNLWTNGSNIYQGGRDEWKTFCSDLIMPRYFKCRIKIHECSDPNEGGRFIGLSKNKCDDIGMYYGASIEWWAFNNNIGLWCKDKSGRGRTNVTYGRRDDVVSVIYNSSKKITFEVNGVLVDDSFDDIEGPFYLACSDRTNSRYQILDILAY